MLLASLALQDLGTGEEWLVGTQLLANSSGKGIERIAAFYEHIGCTPCDAFDGVATRAGPWVLNPPGVKLMRATSQYGNTRTDGFTCHRHNISSSEPGEFTYRSGPSVEEVGGDGSWNIVLYECPEDGCPVAPAL